MNSLIITFIETLVISALSSVIIFSSEKKVIKIIALFIIIFDYLLWGCFCIEQRKIKAIEVYRGKTELKIEDKYINGELVKSDTIVVYKKL